jgi:hypothetical protein
MNHPTQEERQALVDTKGITLDDDPATISGQKRVKWTADSPEFEDREDWEDTDDSCWGFIGREYAEQQATEALAGHLRYVGVS